MWEMTPSLDMVSAINRSKIAQKELKLKKKKGK